MTGAKFDQEFARHMVADHQKDIAEYKKAAKQSDAAGEYAKAQILVLQEHLDTAKSLTRRRRRAAKPGILRTSFGGGPSRLNLDTKRRRTDTA